MKLEFIKREDCERLLLIFAGWSTDASAFDGIKAEGYDIAVLSEWLDEVNLTGLVGYSDVAVMAWSLGVWAAARILPSSGLPLTLALAVNGTMEPVSDNHGIPESIFRGTADGLGEATLKKFRRRMGAADLPRGNRSIEALAAELKEVCAAGAANPDLRWDRAVVSHGDLIFPPSAQISAWRELGVAVDEMDGPHTPPSWQEIVDRYLIDKSMVCRRFTRGMATYADESSVQQRISSHLLDLWRKHSKGGGRVLEVGCGDGSFTGKFVPVMKPEELQLWDIISCPMDNVLTCVCDGETEIMDVAEGSFDAIVAANTIQWFNSPLRFIQRAIKRLRPGGLLVLSTFGPETFRELTESGVVPLPYLSLQDYKNAIPEGAELLECHDGVITKVFDNPQVVIRHLQATGVNARTSRFPLRRVLQNYPRRPDGRVSLTYNPVYLLFRFG